MVNKKIIMYMAVSKKENNEKLFIIEKAPGNSKPTINTLSIKKAAIKDNRDQPKIL
tara:strand:+ start:244 stop:411 length:168 start_codon:yes stop_codon:yes gene_type:complete